MPLKYGCFISYRHHIQSELAKRFIDYLHEAISSELAPLLGDKKIYLDKERIKGGDFYNPSLSKALCESACMIIVFTPTYFDKEFTFCTREYMAMKKLEQMRFEQLGLRGAPDYKQHGLIIPIVLRGVDRLPSEIKDYRHYYNFDSFLLCNRRLIMNSRYALQIKDLANCISERYEMMKRLSEHPCDTFTLPDETEITEWLESVGGSILPLPGR